MDLEVNCHVIEKKTKENFDNGEEYIRPTETAYWNLMLDKQIMIIEEKLVGHKSFLPQKVVWCEIWIRGL